MEIHWLADLCVVGVLLFVAYIASAILRGSMPPPDPEMGRSRLRAALDGGRTGTWIWALATHHFGCDKRACANLGVPSSSILAWSDFLALVEPSERPEVEYLMRRASESDAPFELVAHVRAPEGADRYVELKGERETNSHGHAVRLSGTLRDVTQERQRSIELRRQAQILAQVHDAIIATTLDGRILSWNAGAQRMYGYDPGEATGKKLQMLWFPEDRQALANQMSAAALASGTHELISRVRHKSGIEIYAHFRLALLRDAEGTEVGLLACSHDVTLQRQENELLTLQASALESIGDSVIVTDKHGRILHKNSAASALFRMPTTRLAGMSVSALLAGPPQTVRGVMFAIETALARHKQWSGELACAQPGGAEPIITRASVTALDLSNGTSWVWVQHDITDQRRAEAALRERERRFRNLADSAPIMVWMTGSDGACEYVNQAWLSHSGMTREEAKGFGWQDAIHPKDRTDLERLIDCRQGPKGPFEVELRMSSGDGRITHTLARGAPRVEGGEIVGFIGSAIDISNIKRVEQERVELEQQALKSQKLHSLGVLAGGIAHDFNNLLVSVLGFSDLALRELEPRHPARELVEQIEIGSRRAAALVEQVLTFAGKARRANEDVDVNEAVLEMVKLLERTVGPKVVFELELDPALPELLGDPAQLRQVVMNLVLNASDALGPEGGRIRVRTCVRELTHVEALALGAAEGLPAGEYLQLEVHDGGCGMDEETLSQIFDPFFTTKFAGRGLGLSSVMGVVRSHAGAIQVESARGAGSSFRALFPLTPARVQKPDEGGLGDPCVLLVDDDPTVMQATRQMLQSGGLKVFGAQTEVEALALFERHSDQVHLVILDVVMPNTTPLRIASLLQRIRGDVRILLTSGFSESHHRPAIDGRTFVGFVPKPYNRAQLLQAVAAARPAMAPQLSQDAASL